MSTLLSALAKKKRTSYEELLQSYASYRDLNRELLPLVKSGEVIEHKMPDSSFEYELAKPQGKTK